MLINYISPEKQFEVNTQPSKGKTIANFQALLTANEKNEKADQILQTENIKSEKEMIFQEIEKLVTSLENIHLLTDIQELNLHDRLWELLAEKGISLEDIHDLLEDTNDLQVVIDQLYTEIYNQMKENNSSNKVEEAIHRSTAGLMHMDVMKLSDVQISYQDLDRFLHEIQQILKKMERLINVKENAGKLLTLLGKWSDYSQKMDETELAQLVTDRFSEKEASIWKHLTNIYDKRNFFHSQQAYQANASINRSDVMSWLQQAFDRYTTNNHPEVSGVNNVYYQSIPISAVEQYVIHVQNLDKVDRISDEMISKFQNIIQNSRFVQANQGNQLSIMLQPESLGNMTVRLMQMDGEMTVKIIVTTQFAREMLESNLHQLKHLFSPHQVVIERDETIKDEEFFARQFDDEKQEQDETKQQFTEQNDEEERPAEGDFESLFEQIREEVQING